MFTKFLIGKVRFYFKLQSVNSLFSCSRTMSCTGKQNRDQSTFVSGQVSSRLQLTVIGNGANANPISIAISTDKLTHLFNCGEGVQRLLFEHKIKIGKIKSVFLTNARHENFAGLFGFLLTVAPYTNSLDLYVPSQWEIINKLYEPFMYHASNIQMNFKYTDQEQNKCLFEDQDFAIQSTTIENEHNSIDFSTIYFILMKNRAGTLLIEKCKELNIPPGPLFAKLKSGEEIDLDGKIIKPIDVLGPTEIAPAFVILECPTKDHISSLIKKETFKTFLNDKELEFIIHVTPKHVLEDLRYSNWLKSFDSSTKHIFLNKHNKNEIALLSSSIFQIKLNSINGKVFPKLNESSIENYQINSPIIKDCPTLLNYNLRPIKSKGITFESQLCQVNHDVIKEDTLNQMKKVEVFKDYCESVKSNNFEKNENFKPNVLFFGTGSATPGKLRNTSSILVNFEYNKSMLFDCGEATFLQMNRFYGGNNIETILSNIKTIFISHLHADHHFGLIRLIKEHSKLNLDPLILIAPKWIELFLMNFSNNIEDLSPFYQLITCNQLQYGKELNEDEVFMKKKICDSMSLDDIVTVEVPHCNDSHGIVVNYQGNKIAYSGDSMYSDAFDEAGRDCLILIHEATMNDDLDEEAKLKRHSTISEAINVGRNIGAKHTLLTHFSQRYAKIAPINLIEDRSLSSYIEQHVGIAFDFMKVNFDEIWQVTKMKPILEKLFVEEIQQMQDVLNKRAIKRKLLDDILGKRQIEN